MPHPRCLHRIVRDAQKECTTDQEKRLQTETNGPAHAEAERHLARNASLAQENADCVFER